MRWGVGVPVEPSSQVLVLAVSALLGVGLAVVTARSDERIALPLCLLFVSVSVWAAADAARLAVVGSGTTTLWYAGRVVGGSSVGPLWLWVVLEYLDREALLGRARLGALLVVPATTVALLGTGFAPELVVRAGRTLTYTDPLLGTTHSSLEPDFGPWFRVNAAYNYVLILAALGLLVRQLRGHRDAGVYRGQTAALLLGMAFPFAVNAAFHAGLTAVDLTAASFVVGLALFAAAIFRYELFRIVPIARNTAVENLDDGFLVLDRTDRIVDANAATASLFDATPADLVDTRIDEVSPRYTELLDAVDEAGEFTLSFAVPPDGRDPRHFDVSGSPIRDGRDRYVGQVLLVTDVTERVRRERRLEERTEQLAARTADLERQNERLEEFASVLSHDLRNPLNVAEGRLELARESGELDHLDDVDASLDRMRDLIEDLLVMARQGQAVIDPEPVALGDAARDAWSHVATGDATLVVESEATVRADRDRLLQCFENLFRNSIDHGPGGGGTDPDDSALTVTLGALPDGFFVEDDGVGIPEDDRESVFDRGYSTTTDGTGVGLSIVRLAVEAHGWTITATESESGGARFDVRDVGRADPASGGEGEPA